MATEVRVSHILQAPARPTLEIAWGAIADLTAAFVLLTQKLDLDGGTSDEDYEDTLAPARQIVDL